MLTDLRQLRARLGDGMQALIEAQRIDDAEARIDLRDDALLIAQDDLLRRRLQEQQAGVVDEDANR